MKKELSMPVLIGLIAILVVGVIAFGYRVLNPPEPTRDGKPLGSSAVPAPAQGAKRGPVSGPLE